MQKLLLPAACSNGVSAAMVASLPCSHLPRLPHGTLSSLNLNHNPALPFSPSKLSVSLTSFPLLDSRIASASFYVSCNRRGTAAALNASAPVSSSSFASPADESEKAKLAQVAKRLENTSRYFKRLGSLGFWGQLVSTLVAAVILSFAVVATGKISSPVTFYSTAGGIAAAFISVFWSFGYIRLSDRLRKTASDPSKAPPRAEVVKSLKNGIVVNLLGMGAAILGMQATVGLLVAKALTSSANPYYQGVSPGYSPVLALDVFLVQASANTILSHFLGLVFSLELLRSVTLPPTEAIPIPRIA
ncbi:protein TIC 21, chloroplastic-like [Telopea speciosissima]|uniref:protein TIC 21, chloroplastic-like n=1 Tax=Telopea speciosissima TaxID=54955 RepID=UPI001CC3FAB9|nr:protein TIC 21, chloroplastic-like [Telopea speciosissima]